MAPMTAMSRPRDSLVVTLVVTLRHPWDWGISGSEGLRAVSVQLTHQTSEADTYRSNLSAYDMFVLPFLIPEVATRNLSPANFSCNSKEIFLEGGRCTDPRKLTTCTEVSSSQPHPDPHFQWIGQPM